MHAANWIENSIDTFPCKRMNAIHKVLFPVINRFSAQRGNKGVFCVGSSAIHFEAIQCTQLNHRRTHGTARSMNEDPLSACDPCNPVQHLKSRNIGQDEAYSLSCIQTIGHPCQSFLR